jgi:hypothetical protein
MKTNRAALYLTMGEPYLNELWFELFKRNALDDIDMLYVAVDPPRDDIPSDNRNYFINIFTEHPKVTILHNGAPSLTSALQTLYHNCKEKYYVLLQDDCFVLQNHGLVPYFDQIESGYYDIIGSPLRNYYPQSLQDQLIEQYGGDDKDWGYYPFLHAGFSYWQNMVFGKTQDMLDTGATFEYGGYGPLSKVDFLDKPMPESSGFDIFVPEILMHRKAGKKMGYNDQVHLTRDDLQDYLNKRGGFTGNAPWVHLGGFSNFYGDIVQFKEKEKTTDPGVIKEYERRSAWYMLMIGWYPQVKKALPKYDKKLNDYIIYLYQMLGFTKRDFKKRLQIYSELVKK